eukprot:CAMPEP_0176488298 /NCGR_PEP_ID=MMETSP0200_2-20121128/6629_1 /TAXON_ID=947934 /ORGANISM="Chaetoceros sp., Strain GSL56" /LENGTH=681 /DNA_ID=CAMNT_0017885261 /DNA_START=92 /DNA_END=2137 /DNA_ORIENTATION=+
MAEKVQAILDRMVPSLKDLLDKEVFTESEIKAIVARRRESEYLLCRRAARKSDFLRYIEAEKNLERLRSLRTKKIAARKAAQAREARKSSHDTNLTKPKSSNSIGDASIVQHIHLLYVRAKRKWKDDLSFHLQHAEFAKEKKSYSMLSKIYAEALQIHPRNTGLWIEAASHEYFGYVIGVGEDGQQEISRGGSIRNARVLLQRGLRVNPNSQELWLQSFSLELHYIQKIRGRKEVLKVVQNKSSSEQVEEAEEEDELESLVEGAKLPRIIYKNAIKAIPSDVMFRVRFVEQCKLFPDTQLIVDEILQSIETDFGNVEEAWISRARIVMDLGKNRENNIGFMVEPETEDEQKKKRKHDDSSNSSTHKVEPLDILDEATDSLRTPKMFLETLSFTKWYINHILEKEQDQNDLSEEATRQVSDAGLFMKRIITKARTHDIMSPELCVECTSILSHLGYPSDALEFIEQLMNNNKECKSSASCWLKYAHVKAEVALRPTIFCNILRKALELLPLNSDGYKLLLSELFVRLLEVSSLEPTTAHDQELSILYDKLLLIDHKLQNKEDTDARVTLPSLCAAYINYARNKGDANLSKKIYNKIIFGSNYAQVPNKTAEEISDMKTLYHQCIAVEKSDVKQNYESRKRKLICVFDAAIEFFTMNGCDRLSNDFTKMKNQTLSELAFSAGK